MTVETPTPKRTLICGEDAIAVDADGTVHLVGGQCADCGARAFPRAPVCTNCMSENIGPARLPREGVLYAFSTVHVAPKKWKSPMRIGYVDLPDGVRVFAHLSGDSFAIGDRVAVDLGPVGCDESGELESFVFKRVPA